MDLERGQDEGYCQSMCVRKNVEMPLRYPAWVTRLFSKMGILEEGE